MITTLKFETSEGIVECTVSKDRSGNDVFKVVSGKEHLDSKYRWCSLFYINDDHSWVGVELEDGHYGSPEYKIQWKKVLL